MKYAIAIVSKLSAATVAALLLTPFLMGGPQQGASSPKVKMAPSWVRNELTQAVSDANKYRFQTIDFEGQEGSFIYDITDAGVATGYYFDAEWAWHNFTWRNGSVEELQYPGASITAMILANNRGLLLGNEGTYDSQHAAVLRLQTGDWTLLPDVPGKPINFGARMNERGIAVGTACEGTFWWAVNCVGWMWDGSKYTPSTLLGSSNSTTGPNSINDQGQEVGTFADEGGTVHGYLRENHKITILDVPGAALSLPQDINNSGLVIIQAYFGQLLVAQTYVWHQGVFAPLPAPPASLQTWGSGISDRGDYTGGWIDANGMVHGFIAFRK